MTDDIVKIITDYGLASNELASKIAGEIGGLYSENYNSIKTEDYLKKSLEYLNSYVKILDRDSVERKQLSHLIAEIDEHLR